MEVREAHVSKDYTILAEYLNRVETSGLDLNWISTECRSELAAFKLPVWTGFGPPVK